MLPSKMAVPLVSLMLAVSVHGAAAENFPSRPIRIIVPFGAGGSNDVTTRALARATERYLGQPIIIEDITGGGGVVGADVIKTAKPDGYTIGTSVSSTLFAPYLKKASYDAGKDFTYIIGVMGFTYGVVVRKDAPWKTFQQFLADARANPGKITYGTPGFGTLQHLTMERIAKQQGINWVTFRSAAILTQSTACWADTFTPSRPRAPGDDKWTRVTYAYWSPGVPSDPQIGHRCRRCGKPASILRSRRLTDLPAQKGLTQRSSRFCTTPSRGARKTPPLPQRWHD